MKNFKTTLTGLIAGAPVLIDALLKAYEAGTFTGKTGLQAVGAVGLILLGLLASDKVKPTPTV